MELMLNDCLSKVCQSFQEEADLEVKMNLCEEISDFLLSTPDVFSGSLTSLSWLSHVRKTVKHLLQNKLPSDKRILVFRLMSVLTQGLHGIDWFLEREEKWTPDDCHFFGLLTRLTCIELVMLLDSLSSKHQNNLLTPIPNNQESISSSETDLLGSLLILLEHEMSCLLDNEESSKHMSPDEVGSLISSIRGAAFNIIDFLVIKLNTSAVEDEDTTRRLPSNTEPIAIECLSLVRFLCKWLLEDTDITEEQAEQVTPLLLKSFQTQSESHPMPSPSFEHALLSALISINDVKELVMRDETKETFESFTSSCLLCREGQQNDLPICQEFRAKILLRN